MITHSNVLKNLEIYAVPEVLLIDKNGKTVFKGHPGHRLDIYQDFDTLINGQEL